MDQQQTKIPRHVGIIMDGNGRWAKRRNLPRIEGHRVGAESVREIVRSCRKLGVDVLTLYAFSKENWKRPGKELSALMMLLRRYLRSETKEMQENDIRFGVIGDPGDLSEKVRSEIDRCREATAHCSSMRLNLALSYGGRDEIVRAVRRIGSEIRSTDLDPVDVDEDRFSAYLDTGGMPDLDLLIRTSGEMRISNFLLWQAAYAEIYVTEVLWPDFREPQLLEAFGEYSKRERRFGAVEPDAAI